LWSSAKDEITIVLSHPNGWEEFQQSQLQQAVLLAGLITDSDANGSAWSHQAVKPSQYFSQPIW